MLYQLRHGSDRSLSPGACAMRNSDGGEEIRMAIAVDREREPSLLERVTAALTPLPLGPCHVAALPRIPRNAGGQIERELLRSAIAKAAVPT
jgi:hypothetical protein